MSEATPVSADPITYRDGTTIHRPILEDDEETKTKVLKGYQQEPYRSINAAKRRSRELQAAGSKVLRGKP